jgi:hypothetical protein
MPAQLIYPPDYPDVAGPVVFLAGPIRGAPDWHPAAVRLLWSLDPHLHVANPNPPDPPDSSEYAASFEYAAQVDWETHHLRRAAANGVILFWLAREETHFCDRAYAQTTRFELAEWKVRHERDGTKLVVGVEKGFTGATYIRHRLGRDCPTVPVCDTLEETVRRAVGLVV